MADTVAVMNAGRIEQMGSPTEIYELPRTVFVANFLGQSNLIPGVRAGNDGDQVVIEAHGQRFRVPADRCVASGSSVIVGVRPEKLELSAAGSGVPSGVNSLVGTITDASFVGVSTQYLVRAPWGQELMVFEQNRFVGALFAPGDQVTVHWDPQHSFALDGAEDITAGAEA